VVVVGLGGICLNVVQGARYGRRNQIHRRRLNPGRRRSQKKYGHDALVDTKEVGGDWGDLVAITTAAPTIV